MKKEYSSAESESRERFLKVTRCILNFERTLNSISFCIWLLSFRRRRFSWFRQTFVTYHSYVLNDKNVFRWLNDAIALKRCQSYTISKWWLSNELIFYLFVFLTTLPIFPGWRQSDNELAVVEHTLLQVNTTILNDSFCYTTSDLALYTSQRSFCGESPTVGAIGDSNYLLFFYVQWSIVRESKLKLFCLKVYLFSMVHHGHSMELLRWVIKKKEKLHPLRMVYTQMSGGLGIGLTKLSITERWTQLTEVLQSHPSQKSKELTGHVLIRVRETSRGGKYALHSQGFAMSSDTFKFSFTGRTLLWSTR